MEPDAPIGRQLDLGIGRQLDLGRGRQLDLAIGRQLELGISKQLDLGTDRQLDLAWIPTRTWTCGREGLTAYICTGRTSYPWMHAPWHNIQSNSVNQNGIATRDSQGHYEL